MRNLPVLRICFTGDFLFIEDCVSKTKIIYYREPLKRHAAKSGDIVALSVFLLYRKLRPNAACNHDVSLDKMKRQ